MKSLLSILFLVSLFNFGITGSAFAYKYTASGTVKGNVNGQPCLMTYNVSVDYSIVWGVPPIKINSFSGSLSGCGYNITFSGAPVYQGGDPSNNTDPNHANIVASIVWSDVSSTTAAEFLNSQEMEAAWCNEINNVIVPEIQNQN